MRCLRYRIFAFPKDSLNLDSATANARLDLSS